MILSIALCLLMQIQKPLTDKEFSHTEETPLFTQNPPVILYSPSSENNLDDKTFTFPSKDYDITISMDGDTIKIHFTKKK